MSALVAEPGSPTWALRLVQRIEQRLTAVERPSKPAFIPEFANAAALPAPADWRSALVFVKSIDRVAVSNGTAWLRTDTGASL